MRDPIRGPMVTLLTLVSVNLASALSVAQSPRLPRQPILPTRPEELIRQSSLAISRAFLEGKVHRQTVRLPLSESMYGEKEETFVADRAIGWQGGPQETLSFLLPLAGKVLRETKTTEGENNTGGLPPRITEQILLDYDGTALLSSECPSGPLGDAQMLLQPNTDNYYLDTIRAVEEQFSDEPGKNKRLFLLVNPAWRDASAWGIFQAKKAQTQILDRYETTFAVDQFVIRGEQMSLLKAWPDDWAVFVTRMGVRRNEGATLLGTFGNRPQYRDLDRLVLDFQKQQYGET